MADSEETQLTEGGIATDETVEHDPAGPRSNESTGPKIRASKRAIPKQLGRYTIVRPLGRGGMGAVFEADDPELGRRVAIKVLRDDRLEPKFAEDLRREAQALARLVHPNVVTVHDVGIADGQVFVVMQLVTGDSIDRWLRARGARTSEIVAAFRQAGRGLSAAHAAKLVHCDFKPGNVLVDRDGVVRVTDFGLVRIGAEIDHPGRSMPIAGTPAYMAPEQFDGIATAASDQYAFCVALWELLASERPFPDASLDTDLAARVLRPLPRGVRIPKYISRALGRGLATDPAQRFSSMDALVDALAPPRRRWFIVGGAAVVAAAAVSVLAMTRPRAPVAALGVIPIDAAVVADFAAVRQLTHFGSTACAYAPTVDPSGVVFDKTEGNAVDLYEVPITGGEPRQLTSAPTWEWRSHAGRHAGEVIHLIQDTKDFTNFALAYLDLATGLETIAAPVAANDVGAIANGGIVYLNRSGTELRKVVGDHDGVLASPLPQTLFGQLAVSHRGDRIATVGDDHNNQSKMCLIDARGGAMECSVNIVTNVRPAFGADDRALYFDAAEGIRRRDLDTQADTLVVPDVSPIGGLAIAPDGSALVYSDCGTRSQIVDWSERPPRPVIDDQNASEPGPSNTDAIAWIRTLHGYRVLMLRTDDNTEIQLTDVNFGPVFSPAISPDGSVVAFRGNVKHPGIWLARLHPRSLDQITTNATDTSPHWIDDRSLAITRVEDQDNMTTIVMTRDGGLPHRVGAGSRALVGTRGTQLLVAGRDSFYWVDAETGAERRGPEGPRQVEYAAISPNGRWMVFQAGSAGQDIWRSSLEPPGKPEQLPSLMNGQTTTHATITNKGHVIIAPETWSGDLYVVPAKPGTRF